MHLVSLNSVEKLDESLLKSVSGGVDFSGTVVAEAPQDASVLVGSSTSSEKVASGGICHCTCKTLKIHGDDIEYQEFEGDFNIASVSSSIANTMACGISNSGDTISIDF